MSETRTTKAHYRWDDQTTIKMIESYASHHQFPRAQNASVWRQVFQDVFQGAQTDCTSDMCKWRFTRLRKLYKGVKNGEEKKSTISKFYDQLDELFGGDAKVKTEVSQVPLCDRMCRCCGLLSEDVYTLSFAMDSAEDALVNWFFAFTGLQKETICQGYTKICQKCHAKLTDSCKFREQCLMAEEVFQQELKELSVKNEQDDGSNGKQAAKRTKHNGSLTCILCNKVFGKKRLLAGHMKNHSKVNRYKCSVCDKSYSNLSGYKIHQATHDDSLNLFQCAVCGEKFPTGVYLRYHMNRHTDTRPFVCKTCGKAYHRVHALNHHIRMAHDNIKYACNECNDVYGRPGRLKIHILLQHRGAVLRCSCCPLETVNRSQFIKHMRKQHQTGFNQSIHVILADSNEKLVRRRKLDETLIQTEKIVTDDAAKEGQTIETDDAAEEGQTIDTDACAEEIVEAVMEDTLNEDF